MERILVDFARVVDAGVFEEVVSVNASKYLFSVTVVCSKGWDEVSGFVGGILWWFALTLELDQLAIDGYLMNFPENECIHYYEWQIYQMAKRKSSW